MLRVTCYVSYAGSSNGRTTAFGAVYLGSNPSPATRFKNSPLGDIFESLAGKVATRCNPAICKANWACCPAIFSGYAQCTMLELFVTIYE